MSNQLRAVNRPDEGSSRTQTVTSTPVAAAEGSSSEVDDQGRTVGVLRLRGGPARRQRVVWAEDTVDNEGMGKKKSKICCIYHRPKAFDESSTESDSDASEPSDSEGGQRGGMKKRDLGTGKGKAAEDTDSESDGGQGDGRAR
ncbi:phosphatase inhibitor-domain-containing protein [Naematelia encephala]|uniref:Type 1 phosphatases regulator n=1 Tax=Naematelia encephala TaxID=71784 RepID=A0A1Y2BDB6_9TREE|nr:phosphatase inhibitor-domain-containing protein [Naematelia encephala]